MVVRAFFELMTYILSLFIFLLFLLTLKDISSGQLKKTIMFDY